eukprot:CAMPEP_0202700330 /NCGR_PEP_ID=MMETSP1385-20130828/13515_1 /ASSEMBLY_ACC=CAM_ASM_000861 /TAXON_ID=933848 /ORGANISM="Elphidium margaritaceum" /LENGTH=1206 /DNA_ID=CAMNT_0049357483 /DNA_START=8 /DNA_END=3628 /DNA_ORIENTATION=-
MAEPVLAPSDWTQQTFEDTSSVCRGIIRAIDEQLGIGIIAAEHYARGACLAFFLCDIERSNGWQHGIAEGDNIEFGLVEMSEEDSQFIAQSAMLKQYVYKLSKSHIASNLTRLELGSVVLEELLFDHPRYEGVVVTELEPSVQHHQFGSYYGDEEPKRGLIRLVGPYDNTQIPPIHQRYHVPAGSASSLSPTLQSPHEGEPHMLIPRGTMLHFEGRDLLTTCIVLRKGDRVEFDVYRDRSNADVPFGATNIVFLDPDREQRQYGFIYRFFFKQQTGQYGGAAVEQKFGQIKSTYQDELFWHQSEIMDRDEEIQIGDEVEFVREIDEQHGRVKATRITFLPKNSIQLTELSKEVFNGKVESSTSYSKPPLIEYDEAQTTTPGGGGGHVKQLIEVQTHSNEHYILVKGDLVEFRTESKQENPTKKRAVQVVVTKEAERTHHGVVHKLQKQLQHLPHVDLNASSTTLQKYMNLYGEIEYYDERGGGHKRQIWFYLSEWFDPAVEIYEGLPVEFNVLEGHNSQKQRAVRLRPVIVPLTKQQRKQQQQLRKQEQQEQKQRERQQQQQQQREKRQQHQQQHQQHQHHQQQQAQFYDESVMVMPNPRQPQRKNGGRKPPIFRSLSGHLDPTTTTTTIDANANMNMNMDGGGGAAHITPRQSPMMVSSDPSSMEDSNALSKAKKARMRRNRNKKKNSQPKPDDEKQPTNGNTNGNANAGNKNRARNNAPMMMNEFTTPSTAAVAVAVVAASMEEGTPHSTRQLQQSQSRPQSRSQSAYAPHSGWNDGYYQDNGDNDDDADEYERHPPSQQSHDTSTSSLTRQRQRGGGGGGGGRGDWRVNKRNEYMNDAGYTPHSTTSGGGRGRGDPGRGQARGRSQKQYNRDRNHIPQQQQQQQQQQWNDDNQSHTSSTQAHKAYTHTTQQQQPPQPQAQAQRKTNMGNNPIPSFDTMVAIEGIVEEPMRSKHGRGTIRYQWKRQRRLHVEGKQNHTDYEEFEEEKFVEYDYDSKANWQRRIFLTQGDRVRLFFRLIDDNEAQLAYVTLIDPVYKQRMYGECYYYHPTQTYYLHNKYGRDYIELWPYHIVDKKVQSYNLENEMFVFDLAEHSSFGTDNLTATRCRWVRLEDKQYFNGKITATPTGDTDYGCIAYEDPNDGEDKTIRYSLSSLSKQYVKFQKMGDDVKFHIEHILTKSTYDVIPPTAINVDSRVMYRKKTAMKQ